jgi:hypothetical protein
LNPNTDPTENSNHSNGYMYSVHQKMLDSIASIRLVSCGVSGADAICTPPDLLTIIEFKSYDATLPPLFEDFIP